MIKDFIYFYTNPYFFQGANPTRKEKKNRQQMNNEVADQYIGYDYCYHFAFNRQFFFQQFSASQCKIFLR